MTARHVIAAITTALLLMGACIRHQKAEQRARAAQGAHP